MDKKDEVNSLISNIQNQAEELIEDDNTESMTAEEIVILATEIVTNLPVSTIEYGQPIGIIDRDKVIFVIDEEYDLLLAESMYEDFDF